MARSWRTAFLKLTPVLVVLVGLAMFLPARDVGFFFDDYFHLALVEELDPASAAGALGLWSWARDGKSQIFAGPEQGSVWPWWSAPDLHMHFFRPLPALVHGLDHRLHGRNVVGWHATNLVLWSALLLVTLALYRELDRRAQAGPGVVLLAGLLFALDDAHTWNVVWLATRHSLVAVLFSVAAITAYLGFRRTGSRGARAAALGLLVLALFSAEVAVGVALWVAAYELLLAREHPAERLGAATPMLLVTLVYVVLYTLTGHGTHGTGWYVDPFDTPAVFLRELFGSRLWDLLQGLLTPIAAELGPIFGMTTWVLVGRVAMVVVVLAFLPLVVRDRTFRFVAAASLLSILPTSVATPINYLLLLPSVGAAWLFAAFFGDVVGSWRRWWRRRRDREVEAGAVPRLWRLVPVTAVALLLLASHLLLAPSYAQAMIEILRSMQADHTAMIQDAEFPDPSVAAGAQVLVVSTPTSLLAAYYGVALRVLQPPPWPGAIWTISSASGEHRLRRDGERSFVLEIPEPGVLGSRWDRVVQHGTEVAVGSVFRSGELEVEVTRLAAAAVREVRVRIHRPLDAPSVWLLWWDGEQLSRFRAPAVGERVTLTPADPVSAD